MSIYIKDMEIPETCDMCPLLAFVEQGEDHEAFCYCRLNNWKKSCTPEPITVFQARHFRHLECPLIEIPEHGRLIDADAYMRRHAGGEMLKFAPTVIEAEEGEP